MSMLIERFKSQVQLFENLLIDKCIYLAINVLCILKYSAFKLTFKLGSTT
jgi:hypothetical protein